ncbi:MAG: DivIVA domain-containing protein [Oscillospiraceae bacterium]|nr:DivIVA domain-containing protein [Oscillospiraceae bacterium]
MFTPEQLTSLSFAKKFGGGYNPEDVDKVFGPLVADYTTLYNENLSMRSKMKVLVAKLEEYRSVEDSMKEAILNTQKSCDAKIAETKVQCAGMIRDAQAAAREADRKIAAEEARVEDARQLAARQIADLRSQLESCTRLLTEIQNQHRPVGPVVPPSAESTDKVADEISASLEALVGTTIEQKPRSPLAQFADDPSADMFANLQFGKNYDPNKR